MTIAEEELFDDADPDVITELPEAAQRLSQLKAEKAELEKEILFIENWIDNHAKKPAIVEFDGKQYRVTPVRGKTTTVNLKTMARLVPDVAKRVIKTEEKVDNDLLAKEIERGNIPVDLMKQFITQKDKKTSIRVTEYTPNDEEEDNDE